MSLLAHSSHRYPIASAKTYDSEHAAGEPILSDIAAIRLILVLFKEDLALERALLFNTPHPRVSQITIPHF
ncbi:hypothetical protein ABKN59_007037 [Abortiporus biennis]